MPCIVWERVADTRLNRFLAAAMTYIARDSVMRMSCPHELAAIQDLLAGVRPNVDAGLLNGSRSLDRTERAYDAVAAIARLILQHTYLREGERRSGLAFLVNIEALFEKAVCRAFIEAGLDVIPKYPVHYVREISGRRGVRAFQADLYCFNERMGPLVVDAKYKTTVSSANLHQVITYCFLTGARRAVLVVPKSSETQAESYTFTPGQGWASSDERTTRVHVVSLDTTGQNVASWRANSRSMVNALSLHL